jgi:methionyl-tRNA formyltransferase
MRILFAGTPEIAVPSLERIAAAYPCVVLTGTDRHAGRGRKIAASPVKQSAAALGLRVIAADVINAAVREEVRSVSPDILVVAAFGRIFRKSFLEVFPLGGINLHPSLLPKYRGPAPVTAAILGGDKTTGVTIQRIALAVDSGAVLAQEKVALTGNETTESLSEELGIKGADLLMDVLKAVEAGTATESAQDEASATYCSLVRKEHGRIDWGEEAGLIERKVRAYDPWPRAYTTWNGIALLVLKSKEYPDTLGTVSGSAEGIEVPAGKVVGLHPEHGLLVQTGKGVLAVERLQLQNRKAMDWRSFVNGHPEVVGSTFGRME